MKANGKLYVAMAYGPIKKHFVARIVQGNDTLKTKTITHGPNRTIEQAYAEVVKETKIIAKEYCCEFDPKPMKYYVEQGNLRAKTKNKENPVGVIEENPLIAKFGNELAFKAMIKHAIKQCGVDKVIDVLAVGTTLAKEHKAQIEKRATLISAANIEIARVILKARAQGVDMDAPTKEIESAISWVIENDSKPKRQGKGEVNGKYKLGSEEWNGNGHAPASFSAYLNKNPENSLDDLRVN